MLLLLGLVRVEQHVHGHALHHSQRCPIDTRHAATYTKSTFAFWSIYATCRLSLSIMRGRERVLMLCWGISWRGHSGRCFGRHFPCRHSSADLYKVILSRAEFASVAGSIAGHFVALTFHPTVQSILWEDWAVPCLGRPLVPSRALCTVDITGLEGVVG
jgi:hypothetical protein